MPDRQRECESIVPDAKNDRKLHDLVGDFPRVMYVPAQRGGYEADQDVTESGQPQSLAAQLKGWAGFAF